MIINSPSSPFLIETSFINVRWYGVFIAAAIFISYLIILKQIKNRKINEGHFDSIFIFTVILGIIGARLAFVLQDTSYFLSHPKEVFFVFDGGLSIHGAIILGVAGLYLLCRKYKISFMPLANIIAPNLLLSGAIGRWGNFFNQEIVGKPTEGLLKLVVDVSNRPVGSETSLYFSPVFLYESFLLLLFFIVYHVFARTLKEYALGYTLITYSTARIIVEYFRIDYKPFLLSLDLAQIVSLLILLLGFVVIYLSKRKPRR